MTNRNDLPSFAWLRAFDAAGRNGSFKEAARELHVTASSVSHQIRDLERFLGVSLFVRGTRAVSLTPVGERYLAVVRAAIDALVEGTDEARGSDRSRPLRIGMLPFTASEVFVTAMGRLAESLPGVQFAVESRIGLDDLRGGDGESRLDAVIRYGDGRFEGLTSILLTPVSLVPICSPARLRDHPIATPADLMRQPLVVLQSRFQGWRLWAGERGLELPGDAKLISFDGYPSVMRAIEQGAGVGLGLLPHVQGWIDDGRVVPVLGPPVAVPESLYLVFAHGGDRHAQLEALGAQLQALLQDARLASDA